MTFFSSPMLLNKDTAPEITEECLQIIEDMAKIYFAAAALVISWMVASYRELWSLIRFFKLPPVDERTKDNVSRALINSLVVFSLVMIVTIILYITLPLSFIRPELETYLAVILACIGVVYALSYLYFDRIEADLTEGKTRILRYCVTIGLISLFILFLNAFYAHVIYPDVDKWFGFHQISLYVSAIVFAISAIISLVMLFSSMFGRSHYTSGN